MDFIFFPKSLKKPSHIQNFRILVPLFNFELNFKTYNLGLKTFKKAQKSAKNFLKDFSHKL
jgi:hypothetical protein